MIINNTATMMTLGELNKNITRAGKSLARLASGERITNAGDDASGYAISERMRVRIRALDQDEANVQNGTALLRVAEGAIQNQIELMKTIKEKVIDADNDTNTDIDRQTLQKEINQCYQEIEDIAQETNYNGIRLLVGNAVKEKVLSWEIKETSSLLEGSEAMNMINMIPDTYPELNGIVGPFDLFQPSKIESTQLARVGFSPTIQFSGGGDHIYTLDSTFSTVDSLDGVCFYSMMASANRYVLTKTPSNDHEYGGEIRKDSIQTLSGFTEIDISSCNSVQDVLAVIQDVVPWVTGYGVNDDGDNYLLSTKTISGLEYTESSAIVEAVPETGLFNGRSYFTGGKNESGKDDDDPDSEPYQPPVSATFSLSGITENTGITIHPRYDTIKMIKFVSGDSDPTPSNPVNGVISVGASYSGDFDYGDFSISMSGGNFKITVKKPGEAGNSCYVEDGISAKNYEFLSTKSLKGEDVYQKASAVVDVSGYSDVEDLIADFVGKAIAFGSYNTPEFEKGYPNENYFRYVEFIDSASSDPLNKLYKITQDRTYGLDLNILRSDVENGKSIGEAFADLFASQIHPNQYNGQFEAAKSNGQVIGIRVLSGGGMEANEYKLFLTQGQLRSYTLDYGKWFSENPDASIPEFLNNKGFRAYCASCDNQWFNFHFVTEDLPDGPIPNADPGAEDIKQIYIDVSGVTDAESLVQAICDQATPQLTGNDADLNHFMRVVADKDKLIIYDERRLTDSYLQNARDKGGQLLYEYQWDSNYQVGGAKIADGVWDNVVVGEREIYVKDLVIHHTDRANMNIHLKIPQTTMDHLYGYEAGTRNWEEFNVMTSAGREELLGNKAGTTRRGKYITEDEPGLLDKALTYLTDANCLVGAQIMRLKMAEKNIVTQQETTTASESTIRDADMAKEMTAYTRNNVLAQAAQSMLAQANQNHAGVLNLLQ